MKKVLYLIAALGVIMSSCAATMNVPATAPTKDNDGTCTSPVLYNRTASQVWMHFRYTGPSSGEDSILTTSGTRVNFNRNVPPGVYSVTAWASDAGGAGCDTTITVTVTAKPWKPSL